MTPQQFVGVGVRLFAVWLVLSGVFAVFSSVNAPNAAARVSFVAFGLFALVAAVGLWMFPLTVAQKLVPTTAHDNVLGVEPWQFARIGSALIGIWIIAQNLPFLVATLIVAVTMGSLGALSERYQIQVYQPLLAVVLGCVLVFRASLIARVIAGREDSPEQQPPLPPAGLNSPPP